MGRQDRKAEDLVWSQLSQPSDLGQGSSPLCFLIYKVDGLARTGGSELPPKSRFSVSQRDMCHASHHSLNAYNYSGGLWFRYTTIAQRRPFSQTAAEIVITLLLFL